MKLLHILSCKSQMEITILLKNSGHSFKNVKYIYYKHCDIKANPLVWHDLNLWGLTSPAILSHYFPLLPSTSPGSLQIPLLLASSQTYLWDDLMLPSPRPPRLMVFLTPSSSQSSFEAHPLLSDLCLPDSTFQSFPEYFM